MAPSTDKVKGIEELLPAEDDDQILGQASKFKDRVFLARKVERTQLNELVSGNTTPAEFLANTDLSSNNAVLVKTMIRYCLTTHQDIPCEFST